MLLAFYIGSLFNIDYVQLFTVYNQYILTANCGLSQRLIALYAHFLIALFTLRHLWRINLFALWTYPALLGIEWNLKCIVIIESSIEPVINPVMATLAQLIRRDVTDIAYILTASGAYHR